MASKNFRVLRQDDGWAVRVEGENTDRVLTSTQSEAVERARGLAQLQDFDVIVYGPDGKIQERIRRRNNQTTEEFYLTDRIVVSHDICHGKPRIVGTRIMVQTILDLVAAGKTPQDITSNDYFPDLTIDDVLACVDFARHLIEASEFLDSDDDTSRPLHPAHLFKTSPDMGV